jgi:hypothetical protein
MIDCTFRYRPNNFKARQAAAEVCTMNPIKTQAQSALEIKRRTGNNRGTWGRRYLAMACTIPRRASLPP